MKRPPSRDVWNHIARLPVTERAGARGRTSQAVKLEPLSSPETISRSLEGEKVKLCAPGAKLNEETTVRVRRSTMPTCFDVSLAVNSRSTSGKTLFHLPRTCCQPLPP